MQKDKNASQLGAQDAQFVYMETDNNLSNVSLVSVYGKPKDLRKDQIVAALETHIKSRLHSSPIFTRKLVKITFNLDFPYWVNDEHFNFDSHFHTTALPAPGSWNQLQASVAKIHSRPLNMSRPLWEIHVVTNLNKLPGVPAGSFAVITKLHHCAVDAAAMGIFFGGMSDIDAQGTPMMGSLSKAEQNYAPPTAKQAAVQAIKNSTSSPIKMSQALIKTLPNLFKDALIEKVRGSVADEKTPVPDTVFNQPASPDKIFNAIEFPLADFKFIAKMVPDAKINDVVLAVTSGAVRRYLDSVSSLPEDPLVAWVPINTRQTTGADASGGGNSVTAMTVNLQTQIQDPVVRLESITQFTQRAKAGKAGISARLVTDLTQQLPGPMLSLASKALIASGVTAKMCNLAISNVPGPAQPVYMAGAKCISQYGLVPLAEGVGLFLVTYSYNGKLGFSITATKEALTQSDLLCQHLKDSFTELKTAAASSEKGIK